MITTTKLRRERTELQSPTICTMLPRVPKQVSIVPIHACTNALHPATSRQGMGGGESNCSCASAAAGLSPLSRRLDTRPPNGRSNGGNLPARRRCRRPGGFRTRPVRPLPASAGCLCCASLGGPAGASARCPAMRVVGPLGRARGI